MCQRINIGGKLESVEQEVEKARKYGLTLVVQLENLKQCEPAHVKEVVTRFKGRVKYWEIINEPNLSMAPAAYVKLLKEMSTLIKGIDPESRILGPAVCGIKLPWMAAFYKNGGKDWTDILSVHDYEGNQSINPEHWYWKLGELSKIMAQYGDEQKPIWQTERAIGGVHAKTFIGGAQAVRILLHRDVLETLGIPDEHNMHYYLNEHGYVQVPTYLFSKAGPNPAALATRTRRAMILGRKYSGTLDFGPNGNKIFMGLRYLGEDGSTLTLRNLGTLDQKLDLAITGGDTVTVVDAFGNVEKLPVRAGKVTLTVTMLPSYLRLARGQAIAPPRIDFGRNYASQASFRYSSRFEGDFQLLTNGIYEAPHPDNPHRIPWSGDFAAAPQTLEIEFPHARTIDRLLIFSVRADNPFCTLLDYDLQYHDGSAWKTIQEVRDPGAGHQFRDAPDRSDLRGAGLVSGPELLPQRVPAGDDEKAAAGGAADHARLQHRRQLREGVRLERQLAAPDAARGRGLWPPARRGPDPEHPETLARAGRQDDSRRGRAVQPLGQEHRGTHSLAGSAGLEDRTRGTGRPARGRRGTQARRPPGSSRRSARGGSGPPVGHAARSRGQPRRTDRLRCRRAGGHGLDHADTPRSESWGCQGQQLPIRVKNDSPRTAEGKITVELTPLRDPAGKKLTAETAFGPVEPDKAVELKLEVPGLDLAGSGWHATYTASYAGMVQKVEDDLLSPRGWQVVGPFPNANHKAYFKEFGPEKDVEKGVNLTAAYADPRGDSLRWKPAQSSPSGFVELNPLFKPNSHSCAYAVIFVKSRPLAPRRSRPASTTATRPG